MTLDSNGYYIPTAANNPIFDSFTIDLDQRPDIISVFQVAISKYERLAVDDFCIRQITSRVRKLLGQDAGHSRVNIVVEYFLVCPSDGYQRLWEMPTGWSETIGKAFCIRVPPPDLTVRPAFYSWF